MSAPVNNPGATSASTTATSNSGSGGQAVASNVAQAPTNTPNNQGHSNISGAGQNATESTNPITIPVDRAANPWGPQWRDPDIIPVTSQLAGIPEGTESGLPVDYRFRKTPRLPHLEFDMSTLP
ncbi:hypothetical protein BDN72DRAFT_293528 [Pluteus cervinus]|uniref:Uncharacterized protein n=1 Tax=Pluteus cervinus TaxID=181527 RepID=A0ACD3B481_9AGAR|nr:hypothetical protein BDN72DRAFT_293528 [Pluteus cervinus]